MGVSTGTDAVNTNRSDSFNPREGFLGVSTWRGRIHMGAHTVSIPVRGFWEFRPGQLAAARPLSSRFNPREGFLGVST